MSTMSDEAIDALTAEMMALADALCLQHTYAVETWFPWVDDPSKKQYVCRSRGPHEVLQCTTMRVEEAMRMLPTFKSLCDAGFDAARITAMDWWQREAAHKCGDPWRALYGWVLDVAVEQGYHRQSGCAWTQCTAALAQGELLQITCYNGEGTRSVAVFQAAPKTAENNPRDNPGSRPALMDLARLPPPLDCVRLFHGTTAYESKFELLDGGGSARTSLTWGNDFGSGLYLTTQLWLAEWFTQYGFRLGQGFVYVFDVPRDQLAQLPRLVVPDDRLPALATIGRCNGYLWSDEYKGVQIIEGSMTVGKLPDIEILPGSHQLVCRGNAAVDLVCAHCTAIVCYDC